jgi:hypothetical protein
MDWYKGSSTQWAIWQFWGHFKTYQDGIKTAKIFGEDPKNMCVNVDSLRDMAHQLYERIDADLERMEKGVFE